MSEWAALRVFPRPFLLCLCLCLCMCMCLCLCLCMCLYLCLCLCLCMCLCPCVRVHVRVYFCARVPWVDRPAPRPRTVCCCRYVYPVLAELHRHDSTALKAIARLIVPISVVWLLIFFIVFECILNAIAEVTLFGDRHFYGSWWNSTTFDEFARLWNRPVHEFLLRHVYLRAMRTHGWSKTWATTITFLVSIVLHELVLISVFGVFRPYFSLFSLVQIPLIPMMRHPLFKGKRLGNVVVWFGLITGLPLLSTLYAFEYCTGPGAC